MDIDQADVTLAALDAPDIGSVELSSCRKLFLRYSKLIAPRPHALAESS